ncbi:alpha-ketoglutarate-dependent dioxygenase AlkB [Sorangium sp. So ce119]|uniref:alpha-ketoglutarate-dependent dioxygenase AlkB n=1 Tax=Sorangium sp. So ce119 TaxID=3133279 RepID=UPI003F63C112
MSRRLMPADLDVQYLEGFVADPTTMFDMAERSLSWDDRMHSRRTASCGVAYNYSGISYPDCEMPPFVQELADRLAGVVGHRINNCLANLYADGTAKMGFHADSSAGVVDGSTTSILSLGAPRVLTFRRRLHRNDRHDIALAPGSLLIMGAGVQEGWQHAVLAIEAAGPRISLTFRFLSR